MFKIKGSFFRRVVEKESQKELKSYMKAKKPEAAKTYAKVLRKTDLFEKVIDYYKIRSSHRGKPYVRSHSKWTSQEKSFVADRVGVRTKVLVEAYNKKFSKARTYSSIVTMKSRIKRGRVHV